MLSDFCNACDFVFIYVHILFNTIKKCVNEKKLYDGRFFFFFFFSSSKLDTKSYNTIHINNIAMI